MDSQFLEFRNKLRTIKQFIIPMRGSDCQEIGNEGAVLAVTVNREMPVIQFGGRKTIS